MSKGGSGDEFELKPIDEQTESDSQDERASLPEPDVAFEPVADSASQPAEIPLEPMGEAPSTDQAAGDAQIAAEQAAEQFVSAAEQQPEAESVSFVEPAASETEIGSEQPAQAAMEGPEGLEEFGLKEEKATEEKKKEEEAEEEEEARPSIFARIAEASPYTVLLCAAFAALLVGVIFLLLELKTYDFDIRAKKARQGAMDRPAATSSFHTRSV